MSPLDQPAMHASTGRVPTPRGNFAAIGLKRDAMAFMIWLILLCAMIGATLILGGITRLTESGLSITEWRPVSGALPPLSAEAWQEEFRKYQQIPQFAIMNPDMTLEGFRQIWFWEWAHRNLARALGLAFLLPFLVFLIRGAFTMRLALILFGLLLLGGMQGLVGWWMVQSGLSVDRVRVVPWRLMVHLLIPVALLGMLFGMLLHRFPRPGPHVNPGWFRPIALGLCGLTFAQIMLGALTAGNRAGRILTDWPLMGGHLIPSSYGDLAPFWHNVIENPAAVQFNHRLLAYLLLAAAWGAAACWWQRGKTTALRNPFFLFAVLVSGQVVLGIVTLIAVSPIGLALSHQILGILVWLGAIALVWQTGAAQPAANRAKRKDAPASTR